ncbi:MAG: hypothetical protein LBE83_02595 [Propionibacteriaceae bacterium]|jgi:ABC-2 type transport system permease protein|nr:hypothetical protein [Propionibacteriaceae bacterium]
MIDHFERVETVSPRRHRLSFPRILRSEWIKVFSLRSTWWLIIVTILANVAVSLGLLAMVTWWADPPLPIEPDLLAGFTRLSFIVVQGCSVPGQALFMILCILVVTNEYSSGMIRSTLIAAPRRIRVFLAKGIIIVVLAVIIFGISLGVALGGGYLMVPSNSTLDMNLTSDISLQILGGFLAMMALLGLFSYGLASLIRSAGGAIAIGLTLILILPLFIQMILVQTGSSGSLALWQEVVLEWQWYLPSLAGSLVLYEVLPVSAPLGPWESLGVLGIWAAAMLILGLFASRRRGV